MPLQDMEADPWESLGRLRNRREKKKVASQNAESMISTALQGLMAARSAQGSGGERVAPYGGALRAAQTQGKPTFHQNESPAQHAQHSGPGGGPAEQVLSSSVQKLIAASGGKVKIVSGKRSTQRQAQLYAAALKKYGSPAAARKWVAPPGRSKHEHGLAFDLGGDIALAARLAPQFGLHRPMKHEPWHFELAGSRRK